LFAGFLLNPQHLHPIFKLFSHLSFFKYAFEALVVNEFSQIVIKDSLGGGSVAVDVPGEIILHQFGFNRDSFSQDLCALGIMGAGLLIIGLIGMKRSINY
jgi:hypothetical protein